MGRWLVLARGWPWLRLRRRVARELRRRVNWRESRLRLRHRLSERHLRWLKRRITDWRLGGWEFLAFISGHRKSGRRRVRVVRNVRIGGRAFMARMYWRIVTTAGRRRRLRRRVVLKVGRRTSSSILLISLRRFLKRDLRSGAPRLRPIGSRKWMRRHTRLRLVSVAYSVIRVRLGIRVRGRPI